MAGFTLIELLVVIAIIGILSGIVIVSMSGARAKARDARRLSDMRQIATALQMYYAQYENIPDQHLLMEKVNPLLAAAGILLMLIMTAMVKHLSNH